MKKKISLVLLLILILTLTACGKAGKEAQKLFEQGRADYEVQDFSAAVEAFKGALELSKDPKEIYRDLAITYMEMEAYPEAIENFINALHANHGFIKAIDYDINQYLARAYVLNGQYGEAVKVYDAVLEVKPKMISLNKERAVAYLKLGKIGEALTDFAVVTSNEPKNMDLHLEVFFALKDNGYDEDAVTYLQGILDNANTSVSDYDKGRMCYYLGDYSNGRVYLEKAKNMDDSDSILMLGRTYEAIGDYSYAASLYNTYLASKGNNAGVYNQLGVCRVKMQDYDAALQAFVSGLNLNDPAWNQKLRYNEVIAYEYKNDFDTAFEKIIEYVEMFPKDEAAMREMIFLQTR